MQTWREGGDERRRRRWTKEGDSSQSSHSSLLWVCSLKPVLLVSIDTMLRKRLRATKHRAQLVRGARASLTSRSATQAGVIWQTGQWGAVTPLFCASAGARLHSPSTWCRVFRVSSLRHSTFHAWVTKFTHAAESSQNVPTREGNEAQKGKETHDEHVAHYSLMG